MRDDTEFKGKPDGVAWDPPDEDWSFLIGSIYSTSGGFCDCLLDMDKIQITFVNQ